MSGGASSHLRATTLHHPTLHGLSDGQRSDHSQVGDVRMSRHPNSRASIQDPEYPFRMCSFERFGCSQSLPSLRKETDAMDGEEIYYTLYGSTAERTDANTIDNR